MGNIYINGSSSNRIQGNLNVSFGDIDSELLLAALKDLAVSTTSACTRSSTTPSYVLQAIGVPKNLILSSIRFSIGRFTTETEINNAIKHINEVVAKLRNN
ncbi:MAG: hypothetical protein A2V89_03260 [Gammaproteobacteria bacterium RBG_16_37_9]|nr:MAG: hypothetical protein A2V89_03260 [Gammaproteobacteria bacterium RBG_16_37_9]